MLNDDLETGEPTSERKAEDTKDVVRQRYGEIARQPTSCGCPAPVPSDIKGYTKRLGYSDRELTSAPDGANLGLGCGNPVALASLREGDLVLDLGSGAGFDAFVAARAVGERGKVIGVDMTPEMVAKATENAAKAGYRNVVFRVGDIEDLPVEDTSVDVVISNCVINLAPDKERAFKQAYRVLKPGRRLMVSDLVLEKPLPPAIRDDVEAYIGCIAGASLEADYLDAVRQAGFEQVTIVASNVWSIDDTELAQGIQRSELGQHLLDKVGGDVTVLANARRSVKSVQVSAVKPTAQ